MELADPVVEGRIPIPQITAQQIGGAKGRSLGAYDIDWEQQQNNYLENTVDLEPELQPQVCIVKSIHL